MNEKEGEIPAELVAIINALVWTEALRHIKSWNAIADERPETRRFDGLEDEARQLWQVFSDRYEAVNASWRGPTLLTPNEHTNSLQDMEYTPADWFDFMIGAFEGERAGKGRGWYEAMFSRYFEGELPEAIEQIRTAREGQK